MTGGFFTFLGEYNLDRSLFVDFLEVGKVFLEKNNESCLFCGFV